MPRQVRNLGIFLPEGVHRQAKLIAFSEGVPLRRWVQHVVERVVQEHEVVVTMKASDYDKARD